MPRRRKNQSIDFVMGALKKIALDKKLNARTRLEAIDRMAIVDQIYKVEIAAPRKVGNDGGAPPVWVAPPQEDQGPDVDSLIAEMEKKKQNSEESNAADNSEVAR